MCYTNSFITYLRTQTKPNENKDWFSSLFTPSCHQTDLLYSTTPGAYTGHRTGQEKFSRQSVTSTLRKYNGDRPAKATTMVGVFPELTSSSMSFCRTSTSIRVTSHGTVQRQLRGKPSWNMWHIHSLHCIPAMGRECIALFLLSAQIRLIRIRK